MIKQHTPEWYAEKLKKIGASEIFSLAAHYCKKELKQANIDLGNEKAFKTPLELYLKVKFGVQDDSISEVNSQFGLGMESYILYRLSQEEKFKNQIEFEGSKDFVVNEKVNKMASCSPDGWIWRIKDLEATIKTTFPVFKDMGLRDFDDKININELRNGSCGDGILELKTTPYGFNFEADKGLKWAYLFQLHYQMLVCDKRWGILAAIAPKEKNYDTDFFKGKILGGLYAVDSFGLVKEYKDNVHNYINDYYNLYHYIYPENKTIQNLCILALKRFEKALDDNILPKLSIDCMERLTRERALLSIIKPERYGLINAREDEELNGLINDLKAAGTEQLKIKTEMEAAKCDLIIKMDNHIGIKGEDWTYKFAKNGSLRFSKTNINTNN